MNARGLWYKQVKELEEAFKSVNKALQEAEAGLAAVQDLPSADLPRPVMWFSESTKRFQQLQDVRI